MPNQPKSVLSVKSARCSTKSVFTFGIFFFLVASLFFGVRVAHRLSRLDDAIGLRNLTIYDPWFFWLNGYPVLVGIWIFVTGSIGLCASNPKRPQSTCLIATFGIFSLILIGTESYVIYDFQPRLKWSIKLLERHVCDNSALWDNCYFNVSMYASIILLAAFILLDSVWSVICCMGSLFCIPNVQPGVRDGEQQVPQPNPSQDVMLNENPPPYNPALQASTDNLQGNAPMAYNSGPLMYPAMQDNMQMQGSAPMAYNTAPPMYPPLQDNRECIQGNAIPMAQVTPGEKTAI